MRLFIRIILVVLIAVTSFAFGEQTQVEAGGRITTGFNSVSFACPNRIDYSGQWSGQDFPEVYVRVWDMFTGNLLDDQYFIATLPGENTFSGSFLLADPLPTTVVVEVYGNAILQTKLNNSKSYGFAAQFNPVSQLQDEGGAPPPDLPNGNWVSLDEVNINIPDCADVVGCELAFPVYGTALVLDQQLGYSEPNGEPARDIEGNLIWVLHDLDQDGADTYLIVDIQTGADGETWLGIFIGGCNPVYVPLNQVYPLNAIPVD